jgi:hypothetical protein
MPEFLDRSLRLEKEIKDMPTGKKKQTIPFCR